MQAKPPLRVPPGKIKEEGKKHILVGCVLCLPPPQIKKKNTRCWLSFWFSLQHETKGVPRKETSHPLGTLTPLAGHGRLTAGAGQSGGARDWGGVFQGVPRFQPQVQPVEFIFYFLSDLFVGVSGFPLKSTKKGCRFLFFPWPLGIWDSLGSLKHPRTLFLDVLMLLRYHGMRVISLSQRPFTKTAQRVARKDGMTKGYLHTRG